MHNDASEQYEASLDFTAIVEVLVSIVPTVIIVEFGTGLIACCIVLFCLIAVY